MDFRTYSRKITDVSHLTKTFTLAFFFIFILHYLKEVFQTLHDYNLTWGLPSHNKINDLDFVVRLQLGQKHKRQIMVLRFLSPVVYAVYGCYTRQKEISQYVLFFFFFFFLLFLFLTLVVFKGYMQHVFLLLLFRLDLNV